MTDPVLIFACLGSSALTKHQSYIWQAFNQARITNPSIKIVVILSKNALKTDMTQKLERLKIIPVNYNDLIHDNPIIKDFHRFFFIQGDMVPDGNKQFVQFTFERLLSIYAYMLKTRQVHVFHIENDNMLYIDLQELGRRMNDCEVRLAIPKASNDLAIFSFIYIKNVQALEQFVQWCVNVFRLGRRNAIKFLNTTYINDMTLGARYLQLRASTAEQSKLSGIYELPTTFENDIYNCCVCSLGNSSLIFDACVLGQYFGGTYAKPNKPHWESNRLLDPRGETLSWRLLDQQIRVPYIKNRRITNIHVHSKRLNQFASLQME
ncbi:unnamed protein product [Adineta steineri]|uniref:Uncharacterized protein n=1 Tax=Adineta steineri TaxID=433720 RepID=A0A814BE49_9BILA|nr:unnamed protein product [Adineta steineri]CAF3851412.1 unnamed protein product [Adineta steineri]